MTTYIEYPNFTLEIRVRNYVDDVELDGPATSPVQSFVRAFLEEGQQVKAPKRKAGGADYGVARKLLKHHDAVTLELATRLFWRAYAQPYFDKPELSALVLFSKRLPDILRELT